MMSEATTETRLLTLAVQVFSGEKSSSWDAPKLVVLKREITPQNQTFFFSSSLAHF